MKWKICIKYVFTRWKVPFTSRSIWKMKNINFNQPENQFLWSGIRFLLKKLLPPNYKCLRKPLNKRILFPLDGKSVSTSQNEEFVKKYHSTWRKNCFHSQEYLKNGKYCFSLARETVSTSSNEVFLKKISIHLVLIMVSTSKKLLIKEHCFT